MFALRDGPTSGRPAAACRAPSRRRSVTFEWAEQTSTGLRGRRPFTSETMVSMRSRSPSDVPPNFITSIGTDLREPPDDRVPPAAVQAAAPVVPRAGGAAPRC